MEPTDEYTHDFFGSRISMIVPEIVSIVLHRTLESDGSRLSNEYHGKREHKSRGKIRIHRSDIGTEPIMSRYKHEPIEYESKNISRKNHYHETSEEPYILTSNLLIPQKRSDIDKNSIHDIETKGFCSREFVCLDSHIKCSNQAKK
jgi:hypothetical protein